MPPLGGTSDLLEGSNGITGPAPAMDEPHEENGRTERAGSVDQKSSLAGATRDVIRASHTVLHLSGVCLANIAEEKKRGERASPFR